SSSQAPYPSFPPRRGENSLIPLLRLSPANPLRWASPGAPFCPVQKHRPKSGPICPESPQWGRDSALPPKRVHGGSQVVTQGELLAAGDGVLRQKDPAVFLRAGHQMPAHHLSALKHLEHRISIAGIDLLTALPRKNPLFICQGSA